MNPNEALPITIVASFIEEAKKRGIYSQSQDSLIASWNTFLSKILPAVDIVPDSLTIGAALKQLSELMKRYGSKGEVKASSVTTYETKVKRLLTDVLNYHGAPDAQWFSWKQKGEKKSAQAAAAGAAKGKRPIRREDIKAGPEPTAAASLAEDHKMMVQILPLPGGKRRAELRLPADLRLSDFPALEKTFAAVISLEKARVEINNISEDGPSNEGVENNT